VPSRDDINLAPARPVLAGVFIYLEVFLAFDIAALRAGISSLRQRGRWRTRDYTPASLPSGSWPRPDLMLAGASVWAAMLAAKSKCTKGERADALAGPFSVSLIIERYEPISTARLLLPSLLTDACRRMARW
jgi:hypothetical protein